MKTVTLLKRTLTSSGNTQLLCITLTAVMRMDIFLFLLSAFGAYAVHKVSGTCDTSVVELRYNQLGQSISVSARRFPEEATQALKGSPSGPFIFTAPYTGGYNIFFTQAVEVESFDFQIKGSRIVRIRAFQSESPTPAYDRNVTTDANGWNQWANPLVIGLSDIVKITITWVATGSEIGLQNMVINACTAAPCDQRLVKTNSKLDPPNGFTIDIPGPALLENNSNTNPVAVLKGSRSQVMLRKYNFITIRSTSPFNVTSVIIETKYALGMIVVAFSTFSRDDPIFYNHKVFNDTDNWISVGIRSVLGQISNVKRLDIFPMFSLPDVDSVSQVLAKNLRLKICV